MSLSILSSAFGGQVKAPQNKNVMKNVVQFQGQPDLKQASDTFEKRGHLSVIDAQPKFGLGKDEELEALKAELKSLKAKVNEQDMSGLLERVVPATASISLGRQYQVSDGVYRQLEERLGTKETEKLVDRIEMDEAEAGFGSGFWIQCADGKPRMLTNYHVVEGSGPVKEVRIPIRGIRGGVPATDVPRYVAEMNHVRTVESVLNGKKVVKVPMKIADSPVTGKPALTNKYDLALLEPIDPSFYEKDGDGFKLPFGIKPLELDATFADNKPGQKIVKVGNSAGVQGNVADGVISAFREHHAYDPKTKFLAVESTASISSGDSGGALINMEGKVIGVNQSKAVSQGSTSIEGVGWAVSAPIVNSVLEQWGFA